MSKNKDKKNETQAAEGQAAPATGANAEGVAPGSTTSSAQGADAPSSESSAPAPETSPQPPPVAPQTECGACRAPLTAAEIALGVDVCGQCAKDLGTAPAPEVPSAPKRDLRLEVAQGKISVHAAAAIAFELDEDHVLAHRDRCDESGRVVGVTLVTAGGKKYTWPDDEGKTLTEAEKDGQPRDTPHRNMTKKAEAASKVARR